jgi:type IV secretory pathway TrbL component
MDLLVHVLLAAVGLVIVRLLCEQMIVLFLMHENLQRSARSLEEMQRYQATISSRLSAQAAQQVAQVAARPASASAPARQSQWHLKSPSRRPGVAGNRPTTQPTSKQVTRLIINEVLRDDGASQQARPVS